MRWNLAEFRGAHNEPTHPAGLGFAAAPGARRRGAPIDSRPNRGYVGVRIEACKDDAMTTFKDREQGFEGKYAHDRELEFRVTARRNKLLGLWAAERLGLSGTDAEAYAREVVQADFEEAGDGDVLRKVLGDLQAKEADMSEHRVRRHMDELMADARTQIESE